MRVERANGEEVMFEESLAPGGHSMGELIIENDVFTVVEREQSRWADV